MSRRVTIADVAREAKVSSQTVSRALNNKNEISAETRERVLDVIERLGFRPSTLARGLVTQKTSTLGLVVPDIANPFFSEVVRGTEDAAHEAGYSLLLCNTMEDPTREIEVLRALEAQRVDGIILCSSRLSDEDLHAMMAKLPTVILVNRVLVGGGLRSVCIADEAGAHCAVQHLLDSEHRTIAFLAGPPASHSGLNRTLGYQRALAEAGIPIDPDLSLACDPHLEGGYNAARQLLSCRPEINAFLCYNDLVAVGALQACAAHGRRVPEDIAVVGCDDIQLAGLVTPPLTTLSSDKRALGAEAVRLLLRVVAGSADSCENIVLQPELILRASAPARTTVEKPVTAELLAGPECYAQGKPTPRTPFRPALTSLGKNAMKYVFSTADTVRYRFPTHVNELVLDRSDSTVTEVFIVVLEPGEAPPLHKHPDTEQVFYILEGVAELRIGPETAEHFRVKPGDVVRIPPDTLHKITNDGSVPVRYVSVDAFPGTRPTDEPTWDDHVRGICAAQGWDFASIKRNK